MLTNGWSICDRELYQKTKDGPLTRIMNSYCILFVVFCKVPTFIFIKIPMVLTGFFDKIHGHKQSHNLPTLVIINAILELKPYI